jgi:hypothetical protein
MFKIFKKPEEDERTRAVAAYEKATSLTSDGHEARSLRLRLGMLCRAHLDKTFVAGAQQMESYELACALAIQQAKPQPDPPEAPLFQTVKSSTGEVQVYLPKEYADEAFAIGMLYQKTELNAEQAIAAAQRLADRISYDALQLTSAFVALQFLRDELAAEAEAAAQEAGEGGEAGASGEATADDPAAPQG